MTDPELARLAFALYRKAPALVRLLQALRPSICPMNTLVAQLPRGARVLDVGCGSGLFLLCAAASGVIAAGTGVDINERALNSARCALKELAAREDAGRVPPVEFAVSGATLPAGPFDAVSMIDVMHHVPPAHQQRFFGDAAARVAPGGVLVYKDMCERPAWKAWGNRIHDLVLARQWIAYAPIDEVLGWGAAYGLQPILRREYTRAWYGHELVVFRRSGERGLTPAYSSREMQGAQAG